jgi:hypothetical protein
MARKRTGQSHRGKASPGQHKKYRSKGSIPGRLPKRVLTSSKAFSVLARMRSHGESLNVAAREKGTYAAWVLKHLRNAAKREGQPNPLRKVGGEWIATPFDWLSRRRKHLTDKGYIDIVVKGSKKSSELSRYNLVLTYLVTPTRFAKRLGLTPDQVFQDALHELKGFENQRITGHKYLTNPDEIFRLADAGIITDEELGSDQVQRGGRK